MNDNSNNSSNQKVALLTGVTGQDGSYLSEFLLNKGYIVYGIIRRASTFNTYRIEHLYRDIHEEANFKLVYGDLTDSSNLLSVLNRIKPDEVYNLAAQSHVKVSFELPEYTANTDAVGTLRLLDALRAAEINKPVKFYQASTSELFGKVQEIPQTETTPFYPRSPYACAKLFSYWITINYREAYNLFACNGILFNHESPRRGPRFVTRKITRAVAHIAVGKQNTLFLGNLDSKRDWGHARDYVEAMWLMLQQDKPEDFVISTGETHSVREFVEKAFSVAGMEIEWRGEGTNEEGIVKDTGKVVVKIDERYFRPTEVDFLLGDCTKAKKYLKWEPRTSFDDLVKEMVESDLDLVKRGEYNQ
eukprot:gb/GECH01011714.1/.p1 GENE.gb/GECH01011714.1/~~gb/GECH01011714.1/.p1  ORF type:complete len:360 (+),score=91.38 gb/GECH01011714.1/:1-1080(+)